MAADESGQISVEDAIRLKHDLNRSIKYGGYNASEIRELERLNDGQRVELSEHLAIIRKHWSMAGGFLIAAASVFYVGSVVGRIGCLLAALYCGTQVAYRMGVYYGFGRGFQEGNREGIHRALGISREDASEISERATEMAVDDNLIKKLDERRPV